MIQIECLFISEVFLEKHMTGLRVSNIFLDPTGNHLLIALATKCPGFVPELLYLHRKSNKPKKIEKFRDHEITAVAFNYTNQSETSTGSILIGTSKGLIFETELGIEGEKMFQSNWKQVSDIQFAISILSTLFHLLIYASIERYQIIYPFMEAMMLIIWYVNSFTTTV